jgi:O-antigen/teichoic acid export membrane protein
MKRQFYFIFSVIVFSFGSFFVNYYLSQELEVSLYGQFSLVFSTIALIVPLVLLGQATSVTSIYFSDEKKGCNNIAVEMSISYKIMLLAFLAVSVVILSIWKWGFEEQYAFSFVSLFLLSVLAYAFHKYFLNIVVIFDRYKIYFSVALLTTAVLIATIVFNPSIEGYFFGLIASSLILILAGLYLHKENKELELKSSVFPTKELLILGWAAIPGMMIATLNSYIDRYAINYFLDLEQVAYYSLAATLGVGIGNVLITSLLKGSAISMLQSLQENKVTKYLKVQRNILTLLLSLALISVVLYELFGADVVLLIFSEKYRLSVEYVMPLFLIIILNGIATLNAQPLVQKKKLYVLLYISIFVVVINIVLNILLIQTLGIKGVIVAMFFATLVNLYYVFQYSRKNFVWLKFPYFPVASISILEILVLVW